MRNLMSYSVQDAIDYGVHTAVIISVMKQDKDRWWTLQELLDKAYFYHNDKRLRRVIDNAIHQNVVLKERDNGFTTRWLYKLNPLVIG